jgi:hypothetical protein
MSDTHQEAIARCITAILALDSPTVTAFRRGNPFDKLIRSFDEFSSTGEPLYRNKRGNRHYKMSEAAWASGKSADQLFGEHRVPVSIIISRLLESDRSYETVYRMITDDERKRLDASVKKGGLGWKSCLPANGKCRLEEAGIRIAPPTLHNQL